MIGSADYVFLGAVTSLRWYVRDLFVVSSRAMGRLCFFNVVVLIHTNSNSVMRNRLLYQVLVNDCTKYHTSTSSTGMTPPPLGLGLCLCSDLAGQGQPKSQRRLGGRGWGSRYRKRPAGSPSTRRKLVPARPQRSLAQRNVPTAGGRGRRRCSRRGRSGVGGWGGGSGRR